MDNKEYWILYLTSRRYVSMYIGLACVLLAVVSILAGKTFEPYRGLVSRVADPKRFRSTVVTYLILGLVFIGLSLVAFYLYGWNAN